MSRENTHFCIILKKQAFGEGDELVTVFSKESGKLRLLAKSAKLIKSRLQYGLQVLFFVKLTTTLSNLPKVIGVEVVETLASIRESLQASKVAFYALELLLKFTADEHKNEKLFNLYLDFFRFLNKAAHDENKLLWGLAKFKIDFLQNLGFGINSDIPQGFVGTMAFSNNSGGFLFGQHSLEAKSVNPETFRQFKGLKHLDFEALIASAPPLQDISELQQILSSFLEYQLEREIKSERFLNS